jgi:hypothetical protein
LYHAAFPPAYLEYIHDTKYEEQVITDTVTLSSTKLYDFCDPTERGEWLDIVIALIEYLRSGENKVGFLNKSLERNKLNKKPSDGKDGNVKAGKDGEGDTKQVSSATTEGTVASGGAAGAVPKAGRKRRMDGERPGWDIKVPRKR